LASPRVVQSVTLLAASWFDSVLSC